MHRAFIATAIALAFSVNSAQAAEAHAAVVPTADLVQASLRGLPAVQPTASRKDATNAPPGQSKPSADPAADAAAGDGEQEPSTAMLLAALLVLAGGIALRRRDAPQP